jgi:hypothetical protein
MMLRLLLFICAVALFLTGCGDNRAEKKDVQTPPWPEKDAPNELIALSEDLFAYQTTMGRLPNDLGILDRSGLTTSGPYAQNSYVYHPTGIGVLRDGWRVMVSDDRKRVPDRLWCIVRPPVRVIGLPALRVVLIPLDELRSAASAAGGGS